MIRDARNHIVQHCGDTAVTRNHFCHRPDALLITKPTLSKHNDPDQTMLSNKQKSLTEFKSMNY